MKSIKCRFCDASLSKIFVDLGLSPLANSFLKEDALNKKELYYPLCAYVCSECLLVQLEEHESPQQIFTNYVYFSSYSESWLRHVRDYVANIINRFKISENSLVIEIASNDGYLLQYLKKANIPVLGIEPAKNVAHEAIKKGIPTEICFFGTETAEKLIKNENKPDLLIANNVLAHVPNLNDFVEGMRMVLKQNGIITIEVPHLLHLIEQNQFDTIYHEHFSYFSLITLNKIFTAHKLSIFDVEELPTHGGSLRVYVKHLENSSHSVNESVNFIIEKERKFGLNDVSTYLNFSNRVNSVKKKLCEFSKHVKESNKKVVGYGAAAKGNTLLNYCSLDTNFIEYIVDRNPHKQGLYLPGTHIPVRPPEKILETKPDYVLILAWNLKDEIIEQMSHIRDWGGKFVVPIPEVKVY